MEVVAELMAANNLKQKDLAPLLGSESIVSQVLHGKRELNKQHVEKLSQRFKVSTALFFLAGASLTSARGALSSCCPAFHRLYAADFRRAVS